jgi:hypothetical protein
MIWWIFVFMIVIFIASVAITIDSWKEGKRITCIGSIVIAACVLGVAVLQTIQQVRSNEQQDKFTQDVLSGLKDISALIKSKDLSVAKTASETVGGIAESSPEFTKQVIKAAESNPEIKESVTKAVVLSPKLEEAIRQVNPNSELLPEDRIVISGLLTKEGPLGHVSLELKTNRQDSIKVKLDQGNTPGPASPYFIGKPIETDAVFIGGDIRGGSGTINGCNYDNLIYDGSLYFYGDPLPVPDTNSFPVTATVRFVFEGILKGMTERPNQEEPSKSVPPVFYYRLKGKGTVTIEFSNKYESALEFSRVTYQFK